MAIFLGVFGLLIGVGGYANQYCYSDFCNFLPNLGEGWARFVKDFYGNIATTLIGIAIAVFTIDRANERRAEEQLKAQLIREMGSTDNGIALRAVRELQAHGSDDDNWLTDGSLKGAYLIRANLHDASLSDANLQGAILQEANLLGAFLLGADLQDASLIEADLQEANLEVPNLQEANLSGAKLQKAKLGKANLQKASLFRAYLQEAELDQTDLREANLQEANLQRADLYQVKLHGAKLLGTDLQEASLMEASLQGALELTELQLVTAACLLHATMHDGSHYDGRFNLSGDTEIVKFRVEDDEAMARWYGVPLEAYRAGQEWARENLPRLRREAGLEEEEVAETGETSQPEETAETEMQQPEEHQSAATSSAPTATVVPAKSLLSFTVRKLIGLFWPFGR